MHIQSQIIGNKTPASHPHSKKTLKLKSGQKIGNTIPWHQSHDHRHLQGLKSYNKNRNSIPFAFDSDQHILKIKQLNQQAAYQDKLTYDYINIDDEQVENIYYALSNRFKQEQQSCKQRTVILSKFKINGKKDNNADSNIKNTNYKQKQNKPYDTNFYKDRDKIKSIIHSRLNIHNTNPYVGKTKIFDEQIKKLWGMVTGLQQYDQKKKKNKIQQILNSNTENFVFRQSSYHTKSNSNYNQLSVLGPVFKDQHQSPSLQQQRVQLKQLLDNKDNKDNIMNNLLKHLQFKEFLYDDNLGCEKQYGISQSMPCSPSKNIQQKQNSPYKRITRNNPYKKFTKNEMKTMKQTLQNRMKYNMSKKIQYVKKLNNICLQVKNNENKLNNYFKEIGQKFSNTDKINYPDHKTPHNYGWQRIRLKKSKNNKYSVTMCNSVPLSARDTCQNQDYSNQIPNNFLRTLKCFYSSSKRSQVTKIKNISNPKLRQRKIYEQARQMDRQDKKFSDEGLLYQQSTQNAYHSKTQSNSQTSAEMENIINRKDLRICQKIRKMQNQRISQKQSIKICPSNVLRSKNLSYGQLQDQKVYGKIVQYF